MDEKINTTEDYTEIRAPELVTLTLEPHQLDPGKFDLVLKTRRGCLCGVSTLAVMSDDIARIVARSESISWLGGKEPDWSVRTRRQMLAKAEKLEAEAAKIREEVSTLEEAELEGALSNAEGENP